MQEVSDLLPNARHAERDAKCNSSTVLNFDPSHLVSVVTTPSSVAWQLSYYWDDGCPSRIHAQPLGYPAGCQSQFFPHTPPALKQRKYILLLRQNHPCCRKNAKIFNNARDQNIQLSVFLTSKISLIGTLCLLFFPLPQLLQTTICSLAQPKGTTQVTASLVAGLSKGDIVSLSFREGMSPTHR